MLSVARNIATPLPIRTITMINLLKTITQTLIIFSIMPVIAQIYYVSTTGLTDYNSLKDAYDVIPQPLIQDVEIRLKNDGNPIPLIPGETTFEWTKTGTEDFKITIISDDFDNPATVTRDESTLYMLVLKDIKNIHFYNVIFENAFLGLQLDNVDNSSIEHCRFTGTPILGDPIYQYRAVVEVPPFG